MLILGIETSCDDTSVALLNSSEQGHFVISEKTASQIEIHKKYGGVVPEIAGRMHAEKIVPLLEEVLKDATLMSPTAHTHLPPSQGGFIRPDAIAVTAGPGLITGLIVGVEAARTLSYTWDIPLVAVNHIEGHIHSVEIGPQTTDYRLQQTTNKTVVRSPSTVVFPALALVVSGGHTELIMMKDHGRYEILGATKDDAAGECFDKVAKLLGLPYPGGPQISKLAETGRTDAIDFPRPMLEQKNYDFSFAGLKTSALYWLRDNTPLAPLFRGESKIPPKKEGREVLADTITINDFCASFEQAIVDVLVGKTIRAAEQFKPKTIILGGGVAANKKLRETLREAIHHHSPDTLYLLPDTKYSMDNAAMIAVAGYYHALKKDFTPWEDIKVDPNWKIAS